METVILVFGVIIYFVPTIVAGFRDHHSQAPIFALNLFLGWSVLGWVGALVWSLTATRTDVSFGRLIGERHVVQPPSAEPALPVNSISEEIERLYALKEKGALSEEEYQRTKANLLEAKTA